MKNLLFVAAALLGACATQPPKPAATPVEMTECIALAAPAAKAGATINEALAARRSWREFGPEKLSLEELSGVLWAAAGENRADGKLTAPSALALYPITVYAVFEEGIYRYDGHEQTLTRVAEGDHRAAAGRQPFVATAPLNLVYIADLQTYEGKGIPEENVLMPRTSTSTPQAMRCGRSRAAVRQPTNCSPCCGSIRRATASSWRSRSGNNR